jgi:hypothetical protein
MTIPKLGQPTLNMISAWIGAIATLALLVSQSPAGMHHVGLPIAPLLAAIAGILIVTISRFKPDEATMLALSGGLGAVFSALTYCLIQ